MWAWCRTNSDSGGEDSDGKDRVRSQGMAPKMAPGTSHGGVPYPEHTLERLCSKYSDLVKSSVPLRIHRSPQSQKN